MPNGTNQPAPSGPLCRRIGFSARGQGSTKRLSKTEKSTTVDINRVPQTDGPPAIEEIPGSERQWPADLVLLAVGYAGPETHTIGDALGLDITSHGTIATDANNMTAVPGIFSAGDAHRGQTLIVWAISEGRETARAVDVFLTGSSDLPS